MSDIMHDPVSVTPADGPPTRRAIPPPPRGRGPAGWTTADIDPIAEVRDIAIGELVSDGWGALAEEVSAGRSGTSALRELADNASPAAELAVRKLADVERLAGVLPTPAPEAPICGKEWPPRPGHITGERCLREPGHEEGRCSPMHHRVFSAEEVEANVRPGASTVPPAATDARAEILAGLAEAERGAPAAGEAWVFAGRLGTIDHLGERGGQKVAFWDPEGTNYTAVDLLIREGSRVDDPRHVLAQDAVRLCRAAGWPGLAVAIDDGARASSMLSSARSMAGIDHRDPRKQAAIDAIERLVAFDIRAEDTPDDDADTTPPSDRATGAWEAAIDGIHALAEGILWDARSLAQEGHPDAAALAMLGYAIRGAGESARRGVREGIEAWAAARMPRRGQQ